MKRTFKQYTIAAGGTPQPLIGTTLGAASVITDDLQNLLVVDSSMFSPGDWAVLDVTANSNEERVRVQQVPDGTHIKVAGLRSAHANGAIVRLSLLCQSIYIQTKKVNSGSLYVGTQGLVKATYAKVITELLPVAANVQPIDWTDPVLVGPDGSNCGDIWVDGTTADGYLPSLTIL